ncbi:hypothetical protein ABZ468_35995 [Streptomyces sp. NPDC005708]|uniref:hypothetical protein n=1 Tax=Streptomyces sp. NPDC005708 TaxID=3154564 RepID=UPI0033C99989
MADMDRLRHGAMDRLFTAVRAPFTLGSVLRAFTHGHVKPRPGAADRCATPPYFGGR